MRLKGARDCSRRLSNDNDNPAVKVGGVEELLVACLLVQKGDVNWWHKHHDAKPGFGEMLRIGKSNPSRVMRVHPKADLCEVDIRRGTKRPFRGEGSSRPTGKTLINRRSWEGLGALGGPYSRLRGLREAGVTKINSRAALAELEAYEGWGPPRSTGPDETPRLSVILAPFGCYSRILVQLEAALERAASVHTA
ncbi:hypothetical protein G7Y89_g5090 [Cudoniella acicularis]|uniref:Uncharacterized protein n=1 Tax=Cudoniella acicularis TaxID=354080 RepID=A0A8H4RN49_9HELO|nr:hypothetical protein G7Y89_g5090 [Cudoniella acicularis]